MATTTEQRTLVHDLTREDKVPTYQTAASPPPYGIICTKDDDNLPNIEAVVSFSPNSSCSSQSSPLVIRTTTDETNDDSQNETTISPKGLSVITESSVSLWDSTFHDIDHTTVESNEYVSKTDYYDHDLETLLPQNSLDEYEQYIQEERKEHCEERKLRRALIQEELAILIRATEENNELDGHEFEPEAVEALGVAANRVTYLKKYYNVAKCENVYVPSVAYTIMDGSLLEEASKHYFGKSEEFLVSYAAGLGSTIMEMKRKEKPFLRLTPKSESLTENLELDVENDDDDYSEADLQGIEHSQLASLLWGVSPKVVASPNIRGTGFSFDEREQGDNNKVEIKDIISDDAHCKVKQRKSNKLFRVGSISILVCVFAMVYFQSSYQRAVTNLAPIVTLPELPNELYLAAQEEHSFSKQTEEKTEASSSDKILPEAKPSRKQGLLGDKSPIVPNLLYYHSY